MIYKLFVEYIHVFFNCISIHRKTKNTYTEALTVFGSGITGFFFLSEVPTFSDLSMDRFCYEGRIDL